MYLWIRPNKKKVLTHFQFPPTKNCKAQKQKKTNQYRWFKVSKQSWDLGGTLNNEAKSVQKEKRTVPVPAMATTPLQGLRGEEKRSWELKWWRKDWEWELLSFGDNRRRPEKSGAQYEVADLGPESDVESMAMAQAKAWIWFFFSFFAANRRAMRLCMCFYRLIAGGKVGKVCPRDFPERQTTQTDKFDNIRGNYFFPPEI